MKQIIPTCNHQPAEPSNWRQ